MVHCEGKKLQEIYKIVKKKQALEHLSALMTIIVRGASSLCYVTWNFSFKMLGALRTSILLRRLPSPEEKQVRPQSFADGHA